MSSLTATSVLLFLLGLAGVLSQWRRAEEQSAQRQQALARSQKERYAANVAVAQNLMDQGQYRPARELLDDPAMFPHQGWEWGWLQWQCHQDLATLVQPGVVTTIAFSPDGRLVAQIENRAQTTLELVAFDVQTGQRTTLLCETSQIWINLHNLFCPLERPLTAAVAMIFALTAHVADWPVQKIASVGPGANVLLRKEIPPATPGALLELHGFGVAFGKRVVLGEITLTECQMVNQFKGSATEAPCFTRGYGLAFGHSERKTMSMALVDRALRARELGEEALAPTQDEEFVMSHSDNVQATGFVEHLKLPHYVDFQSELQNVRRLQREIARTAERAEAAE